MADDRKLVQIGPIAYAVVGRYKRRFGADDLQDCVEMLVKVGEKVMRVGMTLPECRELITALEEVAA